MKWVTVNCSSVVPLMIQQSLNFIYCFCICETTNIWEFLITLKIKIQGKYLKIFIKYQNTNTYDIFDD